MKTMAEWFVESVCPQSDYKLQLVFSGGQRRVYDARELLSDPAFLPLRSVEFFLLAHREGHSVVWSDDIDISPEYLYENSQKVVN